MPRVDQSEDFLSRFALGTVTELESIYERARVDLQSAASDHSVEERQKLQNQFDSSATNLLGYCLVNGLTADVQRIADDICSVSDASNIPHQLFSEYAMHCLYSGQHEQAISLFQKCIDLPSVSTFDKRVYHDQIARCHRIKGQDKDEKFHLERAKHFEKLAQSEAVKSLGSDSAGADLSGEDLIDFEQPLPFGDFGLDQNQVVVGDFLIWVGDFASQDDLDNYVRSESDEWEPASQLNSDFQFALLEGQGYTDEDLSSLCFDQPQNIKELLAALNYVSGLVEAAVTAASKSSIESASAAVVFYDEQRRFFVDQPTPSDSPLQFLGRFVYDHSGQLIETSTRSFPASLKLERANKLLTDQRFDRAEQFLRDALVEDYGQDDPEQIRCSIQLCTVLAMHAGHMYQYGQEINAVERFEQAQQLFSQLIDQHKHLSEVDIAGSVDRFLDECQSYGLRHERDEKKDQATLIYKSMLDLCHRLYGQGSPQGQRWQEPIVRCQE